MVLFSWYHPNWTFDTCLNVSLLSTNISKYNNDSLSEKSEMLSSGEGENLPLVEEFMYLGILFMSEGKREYETEKWIRSVVTVFQSLYRSVLVNQELTK